ncbi:MAG: hypothetical protein ABSF26_01660 [Thermoguttaceae bacterium]
MPYPKIVFLYPTFLLAIIAALVMTFAGGLQDGQNKPGQFISILFLGLLAVNLVILSFDFPRTTSLTLFFFAVAVLMACILLFKFNPELLPVVHRVLAAFHPLANATFYWSVAGILGAIFCAVLIVVRFDYWEVRPNELLHHHGFLSNLERLSAPSLRMEKEINDVFEYMLLQSGRLIIQTSDDRRAIVLDNVPFIRKKEEAVTRMLGALQVQVRPDDGK